MRPDKILTVDDLAKLLAFFSIRQYHIGFDKKSRIILYVPKEYIGRASRMIFAYAPIVVQDNIVLKKLTPWTRFKIYFKMAFYPLMLSLMLSACATTVDCTRPQGVLSPGERGSWPPGLYIVTAKNRLPLKWCSETQIEWVPTVFKGKDGQVIDMGEGK